ncbi:helix-turn-helix domain-containing protein [Roseateles sp. 22389]|uniref:helix-turn-helix domain-containing protein n=1 Tax=Roseateles sp. 22389 TaxID=3453916 RepID=UPI003F8273FB
MDGIDIAYRLKRLGVSQSDIARDLGVSASAVGNVIHDRSSSFEVANHVARLLGTTPGELWPQRYTFRPRGRATRRQEDAVGGNAVPVD